jgi:hypothetical protein
MTANSPEVVESLITASAADDEGYCASEMHRMTLVIWNRFVTEHGSLSDEHSTL